LFVQISIEEKGRERAKRGKKKSGELEKTRLLY
jgi:hypothetical protein